MSGSSYLIDTNIALYLLGGDKKVSEILDKNSIYLSFISELELLAFKELDEKEEKIISDFLSNCTIIDVNKKIKDNAIYLRKKYNLKLPDSIIAATAQFLNIPFITSDLFFRKVKEIPIIIYETEIN